MLNYNCWRCVACVVVFVASANRGEGASYRLADLLAGGAIFNGDKLFYNFHNFTETGTTPPLGAANIRLTTISQPNRNLTDPANWPLPPGQPGCGLPCPTEYGLRISGDWDLTQNQNYNFGLDYSVTTLGGCWIYANEIELTGNALNAEIDVLENVTSGPLTLAINGVWIHDPGLDNTIDRDYFTSSVNGLSLCVREAHVSLGIQLKTLNLVGAEIALASVDVYFAQADPEPSSCVLLLIGSAGVGLILRRKRS